MTHYSGVEGRLAELAARVGVRLQQNVNVGFKKDPNWQVADPEQNLRGCLMLSVEDLNCPRAVLFLSPPCKTDVKLRSLLEELFNETANVHFLCCAD